MKFNIKLFNSAVGEPIETQQINGETVEIFYLNDTALFPQYMSKASFVVWASDGKKYRIFIEKLFYEMEKEYYSPEINAIWMRAYGKMGKVQKLISYVSTGALVLIVGIVILILFLTKQFENQQSIIWIFLGVFVLFLISNTVETTILKRKISDYRNEAVQGIKEAVGEEGYQNIIKLTNEHYDKFFQVNSSAPVGENVETTILENNEQIEVDVTNKPNDED